MTKAGAGRASEACVLCVYVAENGLIKLEGIGVDPRRLASRALGKFNRGGYTSFALS